MNVLKGILLGFLLGSSTMVLAVVDINKANIEELKQLKGIGEKKAADIIAYRKTHGAFKSVDELINVKGVGKATLEQNRNELSVSAGDENQEERLEESATKNQKNERYLFHYRNLYGSRENNLFCYRCGITSSRLLETYSVRRLG